MSEKSKRMKKLVPRGFLSSYVLLILKEGPLHGYEIMKKIEERTGFWRPSPGTIYPLLRSLVKNGLIEVISENDRAKKYKLTQKGKKLSEEVEEVEQKMKENILEILSKVMNLDEKDLKANFEELKKKCRTSPLSKELTTMFRLLSRIFDNPEKVAKAAKIISAANIKLRKLISGRC
jgi:DNA-binding PadR family transcriptional regulator